MLQPSFLSFKLGAIALMVGLTACQRVEPQVIRPTTLAQDPNIQVYMNQNVAGQYTEPYRNITRSGDNFEQVIIDAIAQAESSIDIAVQELRLPNVAKALRDRAAAGVKIRVILENTYSRPYSSYTSSEVAKLPKREQDRYQEARTLIDQNQDGQLSASEISERDALVILDNAKIARMDDTADGSRGSGLMHHKFLVIDDRTVIVTSANFTLSDFFGDFRTDSSRGNANNLLKINHSELAKLFAEEFNLLWSRRFGIQKPYRSAQQLKIGEATVAVQFSPVSSKVDWQQTSNGLIANLLTQAEQSIDLALFVFSEQDLVNAIEPQSQRGIPIRALIEPSFMYRPYSEGLDMLGVALSDRCKWEPNNRPWQAPIKTVGVPQMPPGDMLHHKFGMVDRHTVLTGSHNWTPAANRNNDETLIAIRSPVVAAHFQREFERLYTNATLGIPPAIQRKIDAQKTQCPQAIASQTGVQTNGSVNLNTATVAELEALPGVGKGLANRIIAARPIRSIEDLDRVPGVGSKLLERIRDRVTW